MISKREPTVMDGAVVFHFLHYESFGLMRSRPPPSQNVNCSVTMLAGISDRSYIFKKLNKRQSLTLIISLYK